MRKEEENERKRRRKEEETVCVHVNSIAQHGLPLSLHFSRVISARVSVPDVMYFDVPRSRNRACFPPPRCFFFFSRRDSFKACLETFSVRRYLRKYLSLGSYPREWSRSKSNSTKEIVGKNDGGKLIIFFFFLQSNF